MCLSLVSFVQLISFVLNYTNVGPAALPEKTDYSANSNQLITFIDVPHYSK